MATFEDSPFGLTEAREYLRVDMTDHDSEILDLLLAVGPYLYETTGYLPDEIEGYSPLAKLAGKYLLWQWYYGEDSDVLKVERTLNCLLSALRQPREDSSTVVSEETSEETEETEESGEG